MISKLLMISTILHIVLFTALTFAILFSTKISTLLFLLISLILIIVANLHCTDCPITLVEDHYSKITFSDLAIYFIFGKKFDKKKRSLLTLTIVYIAFSLILFKLLVLLGIKIFIVANHRKGTMMVTL